ncbi:hypothetical protein, partial [Mesorhizobium sp.]|uniref:hypothetical protein n=2 Tax=Mesorhizobium sp. TaxID=1871066 RepID=UPI0025BCAD77
PMAGGPPQTGRLFLSALRRHRVGMPQFGTQYLTASSRPVETRFTCCEFFGAQAVDNTISRGEQTGNFCRSLIRRRFVPALAEKLTGHAGNSAKKINDD